MNDILLSLGFAGIFFGAIIFRGIFGYLKNQKIAAEDLKFDWKKFLSGSIRPVALTIASGALTALVLGFLELVGKAGLEVSGLEQISIHNIQLGLAIADIGAIGYAIKEMLLCFGLSDKQIEQIRETVNNLEEGQESSVAVDIDENGDIIAYADAITPEQIKNESPTDDGAREEAENMEVGQGAFVNPLNRILPDGSWAGQCSRYAWYLASGVLMNYAPHPDYGPCNGNQMVDYIVNKLGWVRCGKMDGAIFAYNAGEFGHCGIVKSAKDNTVNDSNWTPHKVSTHYLNLDAVGAVYCCPKEMLNNKPAPAPKKKSNEEIADEVIQGKWGNGQDRVNRLINAGYDPNAIQKIVDSKVSKPSAPKKKSNEEIANEVIQGKWGNGEDRKRRLQNAG